MGMAPETCRENMVGELLAHLNREFEVSFAIPVERKQGCQPRRHISSSRAAAQLLRLPAHQHFWVRLFTDRPNVQFVSVIPFKATHSRKPKRQESCAVESG